MGSYRITNMIATSIIIEDIGIRLPCKGSHVIVDEDIINRSRDINYLRKWIRVEPYKQTPKKSISIWPFSKPKVSTTKVVEPTSKSAPRVSKSPQPDSFDSSSDMRDMRNMLNTISRQIKTMAEHVSKIAAAPVQDQTVLQPTTYSMVAPTRSHSDIPTPQELEPIFIPSQILPQKAQTHIVTKESHTVENNDMEAAMEALRKLRKS